MVTHVNQQCNSAMCSTVIQISAGIPALNELACSEWASPEAKEEAIGLEPMPYFSSCWLQVSRVLANVSMLEEGTQGCLDASVTSTLVQLIQVWPSNSHPPDLQTEPPCQAQESTVEAREESARALANLAYSPAGAKAALAAGAVRVLHQLFREVSFEA